MLNAQCSMLNVQCIDLLLLDSLTVRELDETQKLSETYK